MNLDEMSAQNKIALRRLVLTVEANSQSLELLIAICDDRNLQASIIEDYEAELQREGIKAFRARLNPKQPSMRASLTELVEREPALQKGEPAVVTVLNAEALLGVTLGEEKSEQERFFFSLQWTREALRRFEFAIVLWVPDAVATKLGQRAPDFWSWRGGVFEFAASAGVPAESELAAFVPREVDSPEEGSSLSIEDLQKQVEGLEETFPESPLLITAGNALGEAYEKAYAYDDALAQYEKALDLAQKKNNLAGQARSLKNLGNSLWLGGRSQLAIKFYEQGLEIYREISDRKGEASSLRNLGNAHYSLGQYQRAIDFQQQALEIKREIGDHNGEAASLGNLGLAYDSLGQYQRTIEFYQQALELYREIGDRNGEANSLGNLGNTYNSLGQYQRTIEFQQQALELYREIGDRNGEATALGNLGNTYNSLGQYQRTIEFYQQALEIKREIGNRKGEATALGNLGLAYNSLGQYQRAIDFQQQALEIKREIGDRKGEANSLIGLGLAYNSLGQYQRAIDFQQQALEIKREIGDRKGEANSLAGLGNACHSLGQYQRAIDFHQQSLEIAREIGDRNGEANSLFNKGSALARIDRKWEAQSCYEETRRLYGELTLEKKVEKCDRAIANLGKKIVAIPKPAPTIEKTMPSPATLKRRRKETIEIYFLIGLGIVLFIGWLLQ